MSTVLDLPTSVPDSTNEAVKIAVKQALAEGLVRIDIADIIKQLSNPAIHQALRHYMMYSHRSIVMLDERARRGAQSTYDFIAREMPAATFHLDQFDMLEQRIDTVIDGHLLDLGVYKGSSTRRMAKMFPDRRIHGFDSFEGLPEDWSHAAKGTFGDVKGKLPDVPENVTLYPGWFDATLPVWAVNNPGPIAILRVDCDIYSSTKTIFDVLGDRLRPGSWIMFDELIGYFGFEEHEHKAFVEWNARAGFRYEYVAYGMTYTIARLL